MAIDASIIGRLQPVQIESPVNALAKILQVQNAQQSHQMNALTLDEKRRGLEESNALSGLYRDAYGADGKIDRNKLLSGAASRGLGAKIPALQKGFADEDKSKSEARKAELEQHLKTFEITGQIMSGVRDQASWDAARQQTAQLLGPDVAARLPAMYDPAAVQMNMRKAMSVKDQMEQEHKALTLAETTKHHRNTEANTVRGQNMADARSREFNATKVEENNIKRDEKKATADLTKNSQIASFDTMLGTLDRLAAHPGLKRSVGVTGAFPTMPGSESANFQAELNTFQSQAFLPMVAQLKGMGALSDAEGKKLTAAVGALDPKMGEDAFRESVARITNEMEAARERMAGVRRNGKKGGAPANNAAGGVIDFGDLK